MLHESSVGRIGDCVRATARAVSDLRDDGSASAAYGRLNDRHVAAPCR